MLGWSPISLSFSIGYASSKSVHASLTGGTGDVFHRAVIGVLSATNAAVRMRTEQEFPPDEFIEPV